MRLDKYVSGSTDFSRAEVRRLARTDAITINGEPCRDIARKILDGDTVALNGETLGKPGPRYFMLHKPEGYVSATTDDENLTVIELLDEPRANELQIAGRLDLDTTGLVLITDDGKWNHAITSPKRNCKKTYSVTTCRDIEADCAEKFLEGVWLDGEKTITLPATLEVILNNECKLTISEGRYHQVKRMFASVGNRVDTLHRESIGDIVLDPNLAPGEYRPLTQVEINSIFENDKKAGNP